MGHGKKSRRHLREKRRNHQTAKIKAQLNGGVPELTAHKTTSTSESVEASQPRQTEQGHHCPRPKRGLFNYLTLLIAAGSLLWFIYYANLVKGQLDEMVKANAASRAFFEKSERAWVGVIENTSPNLKVGERPILAIWMLNSGKTPARDARPFITYDLVPEPTRCIPRYDAPPEFSAKYQSSMVIQPGAKVGVGVPTHWTTTETLISDLKKERQVLCMFGKVDYRDIFDVPHTTTFNMFLASNNLSSWLFNAKGNDAN